MFLHKSYPCLVHNIAMSMRETFTDIYRKNLWGDESIENPLSGDGSNPLTARPYVNFVKNTIGDLKITSVLDVGHGDWAMWREYDFPNVDYTGVDIADDLSLKLESILGTPSRRFKQIGDNDEFPQAQMLLSKEVLQHLSNSQVISFLNRVHGFEYLLFCNGYYPKKLLVTRVLNWLQPKTRCRQLFRGRSPLYRVPFPRNNRDIPTGDFRGINLKKAPFKIITERYSLVSTFSYKGRPGSGLVLNVYLFESNS